ncbi:MAG: phosphatidylglycerol lysyltransferase [Treponema sp.]|nr:phosphatidylglycerol lysyltransferase [Treponema sp.]
MIFEDVQTTLSAMILSHSGWRGIYAVSGNEEDTTTKISTAHAIIAAGAAMAFTEYLQIKTDNRPLVLLGSDTRPTSLTITGVIIPALAAAGADCRNAGYVAAPEIMAWARHPEVARSFDQPEKPLSRTGFIYISASHNPIGHNGLKFGLNDGGVLSADEAAQLIARFRSLMADPEKVDALHKIVQNSDAIMTLSSIKERTLGVYLNFCTEVAFSSGDTKTAQMLKQGISQQPLGVCCDFNGSARCVSIDRYFFGSLGIQFEAINEQPGEIAHRIVPEGESLDPCCRFLEELHCCNPAFILGYVPDCDGDRGNLVVWDEVLLKARALEAQEVFALVCVAELAYMVWTGIGDRRSAVVVNDPTSLRIDRIAAAFGVSVFRVEVGEANVVGLARKLREDGYTVRILGEGSNGGVILHPSAVRDPLHTVLALAKLLCIKSVNGIPGLFEIWCKASGQVYHPDFSLADVIASLPQFVTTSASSPEAVLTVTSADHGKLKSRYQHIFLAEWEERKGELKSRYGIYGWDALAYNGIKERKGISDFGEAGKGGLKVCFRNAEGTNIASLWMRGSATEPVFRIMADAAEQPLERELINWQRRMTKAADIVPIS